ncbi:MAG TPA: NAD-glutamate dehydrogenase domain-containing protein, partial [Trebonia sp.]
SVTMELNRHSADITLIVHPLLCLRRDVTGQTHGTMLTAGGMDQSEPPADAVNESWIHVELGYLRDHDGLAADLRRVLDDLRVSMEDQRRMRTVARELFATLTDEGGTEEAEAGELLAWLAAGHFTFLGYREYDLVRRDDEAELRPLAGTGLGILRHDGADSFAVTPPGGQRGGRKARLLVLAKSSTRSTVYRPSYLDYVAIRKFGADGQPSGEYRFLGLYTQAAYTESITRIPVLRRKLDQVLEMAARPEESHDGKDLVEILEGYPREELFEISAEQLTPIALAVLRLGQRKQVRLFLRPDAYGRYMSCLVYLPRDRYTTKVRLRVQEILRRALNGVSVDYSAMVSNSALARLHVVVHGQPGQPLPHVDSGALQTEIAAALRSWDEDLAAESERRLGGERANRLLQTCCIGIPETYKADVTPAAAVEDLSEVLELLELSQPFAMRFSIPPNGRPSLRILRLSPITLSDVMPQLQHMGLEVVDEHPYEFRGTTGPYWIYNFGLRRPGGTTPLDPSADGELRAPHTPAEAQVARVEFEAALTALWSDQNEDDAFNGLVLDAGLNWRQVVLLRAYARYLRQVGVRFSQDYLQRVLRANPAITRLLVRLFESRFDPAKQSGAAERCEAIAEELRGALDEVVSLDHDRILRSYLGLIEATLRTNYFQHYPG